MALSGRVLHLKGQGLELGESNLSQSIFQTNSLQSLPSGPVGVCVWGALYLFLESKF